MFEIDEQLLVPANTTIVGAANPNDMAAPERSPDWAKQTLFLATRGAVDYLMDYCHATDMVTTRVGFVLSSYVQVHNVTFQGIDTIRPGDNGALCGGGAFETKGCAENDCHNSDVNNAGSDGLASAHVVIDSVRLNDFFFPEDHEKVGAHIDGNSECQSPSWPSECCFCKPNGVRSTQVGVWIPQTRDADAGAFTHDVVVRNVVSRSTQADAVNLHGNVRDVLVENTYFENTGDDGFVLWGASNNPSNVTFRDCIAVNPGIMRPNW